MIDLEKVGVTFGDSKHRVTALAETSLRIDHGEFVALVGPSGCGKSTILKLVAGTLTATQGNVFVAGREIGADAGADRDGVPEPDAAAVAEHPRQRHAAAQDRAAVQAGLREKAQNRVPRPVEASLAQVGLAGFGDKFPWQLSGGMQQRASLCRALIHDPTLLLLDEPFGALDQFTREELWEIMQNLWIEKRPTVLLVTHDLKEAGYLASRICVMQARPGRIVDDSVVPFARPRTIDDVVRSRNSFRSPSACANASSPRAPSRRSRHERDHQAPDRFRYAASSASSWSGSCCA